MGYIDANKLKELLKERQEEKDYREVIWLIDSLQQEQPVEGLEENLKKEISRTYFDGSVADTSNMDHNDYEGIARYFAEWGEKKAYKAIMKKADEVRDKRFDTDYEVKIEPAAGFDLGCVNVYHEGKLVGQYVEPREEKKLPEGLEEAAEEYANKHYSEWDESWDDYNGHNVEPENDKLELMDAFIAGAKWMSIHGNDIKEL